MNHLLCLSGDNHYNNENNYLLMAKYSENMT